jgi:hypothetical protein
MSDFTSTSSSQDHSPPAPALRRRRRRDSQGRMDHRNEWLTTIGYCLVNGQPRWRAQARRVRADRAGIVAK